MVFENNYRFPAISAMDKKRRKQIMKLVKNSDAGKHSMVFLMPSASAALAKAELFNADRQLIASHVDQFRQTTICFSWPKKGLTAVFDDSRFNETMKVYVRAKKMKQLAKFVVAMGVLSPMCNVCGEIAAAQKFCGNCGTMIDPDFDSGTNEEGEF